jgi:hypothetical protein
MFFDYRKYIRYNKLLLVMFATLFWISVWILLVVLAVGIHFIDESMIAYIRGNQWEYWEQYLFRAAIYIPLILTIFVVNFAFFRLFFNKLNIMKELANLQTSKPESSTEDTSTETKPLYKVSEKLNQLMDYFVERHDEATEPTLYQGHMLGFGLDDRYFYVWIRNVPYAIASYGIVCRKKDDGSWETEHHWDHIQPDVKHGKKFMDAYADMISKVTPKEEAIDDFVDEIITPFKKM